MNNRQRTMAILNYVEYDAMPVVHFGYWDETLDKWKAEGRMNGNEWNNSNSPGNAYTEYNVSKALGFDYGWDTSAWVNTNISPGFESRVIEDMGNGAKKILNWEGVVVLQKEGTVSIPAEIDHMLKDRESWENLYLPKLVFDNERVNMGSAAKTEGGDAPVGLYCGSLFGIIRNWLGVEGLSYLYADDEDLYAEIINIVGDLCYKGVEYALTQFDGFDFAHFWEDICFKNGPLVIPAVFDELVGPHYRRVTSLLNKHGINIVSLDCDGCIDTLIPTWLENGVNTMFPIEVGTWNANIKPWREKYGKEIRGVGGMNKNVFALDYGAIDKEIERLKPLIALGGYIPCPDHRIAPDAKWENVQYYCEKMRRVFS